MTGLIEDGGIINVDRRSKILKLPTRSIFKSPICVGMSGITVGSVSACCGCGRFVGDALREVLGDACESGESMNGTRAVST